MSKLITFSIGFLTAASAFSQTESPLKFSMNARYRMEESSYADVANRKQFSHLRLRPMLTWDAGHNSKVVMEAQYAKVFGSQAYQPSGGTTNTAIDSAGNTSYGGIKDTLWMRQAYIDLKLNDHWNLLAGRQALSYGDQYIVGLSDWGVNGRVFDGLRFKWEQDKTKAELFNTVLNEATESNSADRGDKTLSGIYVTHALNETVKSIDLYWFYLADDRISATGPSSQHFGDYGTRVVTEFGDMSWKFEYAKNFGTEGTSFMTAGQDKNNDMIETLFEMKKDSHVWGFQAFASGKYWRDMGFQTTHSFLGKTDLLGRRNLTGVALHHEGKWSDLWSTNIGLWYFTRSDNKTAAYSTNSTTTLGDATEKARDLGTELDLIAKYKFSKDTALSASVSLFSYGKYFKDSANIDDKKQPIFSYFMIETKY